MPTGILMRFFFILILATLLTGCSLFGSFVWIHPEKTETVKAADKAECLALASIVYGSPEDLLNFAKNDSPEPNRGIEADCLVQKGYRRTFISANSQNSPKS